MNPRIARLLAGLVAGSLTVLLIDRLLWPGTFQSGLVGVVAAVAVLSLTSRNT